MMACLLLSSIAVTILGILVSYKTCCLSCSHFAWLTNFFCTSISEYNCSRFEAKRKISIKWSLWQFLTSSARRIINTSHSVSVTILAGRSGWSPLPLAPIRPTSEGLSVDKFACRERCDQRPFSPNCPPRSRCSRSTKQVFLFLHEKTVGDASTPISPKSGTGVFFTSLPRPFCKMYKLVAGSPCLHTTWFSGYGTSLQDLTSSERTSGLHCLK
mmetsp:Transcript_11315/g.20999  ORF Transcript_11315/g.20999 Transcript_11315/m.20999 type:complete len:214 (+) Transcript_11315:1686-2327(+)